MSQVIEEMKAILCDDPDVLMHYGMPRRSGRYPWGSGEDPYQHSVNFLSRVEKLRKAGYTYTDPKTGHTYTGDTAIAKGLGLTSTEFRTELSIANGEVRQLQVDRARALAKDGLGATAIGREMGISESTVRSLLNERSEARMKQAKETAEFLKNRLKEVSADGGMIDVGAGVNLELNISNEKLNEALYLLKREGYEVYNGRFEQANNPGKWTTQKVLCEPGTEYKEIYNLDKVHTCKEYISRDGGDTYERKFNYPESLDSSRIMIRYKEDGGIERDGLVELRRNVPDLSLGESRYSQVRILVDGTHYIKGMAVYSDNMPDGVDVVFNTNKSKGTPIEKVLKEIKRNPLTGEVDTENPFGSLIKDADKGGQYWYDPKTGERCSAKTPGAKLGLINKRADEGDWTEWKDALPSQFLSKQSLQLAKKQLGIARADKEAEYDDICSLNNPTIKKHLLQKFSDECDAAAVNLQAAALPGQKYHVIIPINTLTDKEVYAPKYEDGTKLALIRYPHGGTFEIPIVTVNNKNKLANEIISKTSEDAIGINSEVAERLSGADFDGDTVMCIPTHDRAGKVKIASTNELEGLKGFDPKMSYPERPGMKYMKDPVTGKDATQSEMGKISNLITDMTLGGATTDELARAVRHSMVVIDAGKHKLDYKRSEQDNNIAELKKKYQAKYDADGNYIRSGGASTIISRAKGEETVLKRQGTPKVNIKGKEWYDPSKPEGSLIYKVADDVNYSYTKVNKRTGEEVVVTKQKHQKSTKMGEVDDAYELVSHERHPMEIVYADYANAMKSMANRARLEMMSTGKIAYDSSAAKIYAPEVQSLKEKVITAEMNKTRERAAQRMTAATVQNKLAEDPTLKKRKDDLKKIKQQSLTKYRQEVGNVSRSERSIKITDKEWEAIQAGAISETQLKRILNNTDIADLRERATPRTSTSLSAAQVNRIKAMSQSYTLQQIANQMGISPSTVSKYLKGAY